MILEAEARFASWFKRLLFGFLAGYGGALRGGPEHERLAVDVAGAAVTAA